MIADSNTRNNVKAIYSGIRARHRAAYNGGKWWKCRLLNNWKFVFEVIYL